MIVQGPRRLKAKGQQKGPRPFDRSPFAILPRRYYAAGAKAFFTEVKVVFRLVPTPCTTAMIATEMPAAMRPYSMAVAPDSSLAKRFTRFFILSSIGPHVAV